MSLVYINALTKSMYYHNLFLSDERNQIIPIYLTIQRPTATYHHTNKQTPFFPNIASQFRYHTITLHRCYTAPLHGSASIWHALIYYNQLIWMRGIDLILAIRVCSTWRCCDICLFVEYFLLGFVIWIVSVFSFMKFFFYI